MIILISSVSCGNQNITSANNSEQLTEAASGSTNPSGTETEEIPEPNLPDIDYGGGDFVIMIRDALTYKCVDVYTDSVNGEVVNDAVFDRNAAVENKMNMAIVPLYDENVSDTAKHAIMSGDDICDVMFDSMNSLFPNSAEGQYVDYNKLPYIDFNKQYWDTKAASELSICNRLYMMVSDISMNASSRARFLYFNKNLIDLYRLGNPYQYVYDNKWTLESFGDMVKGVSDDLNGDGIMDGSDRYGLLEEVPSFFAAGAGVLMTENDNEDIPQMTFMNDRTVSVLEDISDIIYDTNYAISYEAAAKGKDTSGYAHIFNYGRSLFANDQFLFVQNGAEVSNQFKDMKSDYGIVPNPKYDEQQENYYHLMDPNACAMSIPITNQDTDKTAAVLEYMSWASSVTLVPAFYETTIKLKRLNDPDAPVMLDIILSSIRYDLSYIAQIGIDDIITKACKTGNLASEYSKKQTSCQEKIDNIVNKFRN